MTGMVKHSTTEEVSDKRGEVTILVVFVSCSKLAEFCMWPSFQLKNIAL